MSSFGNGGGVFSMFGSAAQHLQQQQDGSDGFGAGSSSMSQQHQQQAEYNPFLDPHRGHGGQGSHGQQQQQEEVAKELDLVFIMDATGSMGSYIASATKNIETICDNIIQSEQLSSPGALRIGLVAFRDHPPQDYSFITKEFPFTSDVSEIKAHLKTLYATGGGDGPEAVTAAIKAVLDLQWRPTATRLAVLIADAPPHGIGEYGDGFPQGSPEGSDPLILARLMAQAGISLFMVACEPALSSYSHAADFYQGIVRITSGLLVPLTTASLLTHVIIAAAGEAMALDRLHREVGDEVADRLRSLSLEGQQQEQQDANSLMDEVAHDLHQRLLLRNENTKQLVIESIYRESAESKHNIQVWSSARDLASAKPLIQKVHGSRLSDNYLQTRRAKSTFTTGAAFPSSPSALASGSSSSAPPSSTSMAFGSPSHSRFSSSVASTSPTTPRRHVVSNFSAFTGASGLSVGSPPQQHDQQQIVGSPSFSGAGANQQRAGFGRGRSGGDMSDDDDDDDDDEESVERPLPVAVESREEYGALEVAGEDGSKLRFRQGAISLDQARRLAMQSAYRGGLA